MLQFDNRWKVLQIFFDEPLAEGGHQLREISRKAQLALPSVKKYLQELEKEGLILKKKERVNNFPRYYANLNSLQFKFYKKTDLLLRIEHSGLIQKIWDSCLPNVIIIFGSASRGEDNENSDLDLFVASSPVKLDLKSYERELRRKINLYFEPNFHKISPELKNNLLNGVILSGYIKVF